MYTAALYKDTGKLYSLRDGFFQFKLTDKQVSRFDGYN